MSTIIILLGGLALLMVLRVPIAFALLIPSLVYVGMSDGINYGIALQRTVAGVNTFPLLAIPMFILMGELANRTGVAERLFHFALALLGHVRGSLGYVNVLSSLAFAWMSGSAVSDAAAMSKIHVPAMTAHGYSKGYAVSLTGAAALMGPIMPPSVTAVVYGVASGVSIGSLFIAGIIPALLIALVLMAAVYFHARKRPELRLPRASAHDIVRTGIASSLPLLTPVIVLGGILGGVFTPTEAAGVAVLYMIVLGVAYRTLSWVSLMETFRSTVKTSGSIMFIIATASLFGWILGREQMPQAIAAWILAFTNEQWVFLLLLNLFLLLLGMVMEPNSAILILVPVIMPIAESYGVAPVHLGAVVIINLMIGLLTPPVGLVLFVLSSITKLSIGEISRHVVVLLIPLCGVLFLVTYLPWTTLGLVELMGFR